MTSTSEDVIKRYGIPDWRDPAAYPFHPVKTPDAQWRWQFLRRRVEYRQQWDSYEHRAEWRDGLYFARTDYPTFTSLQFGTPVILYPALVLSDEKAEQSLPPAIGRTAYGITWMSEEIGRELDAAGIRALAFNLNLPIGPQIAAAKEHLMDLQRNAGITAGTEKPRKDNWAVYLRALDGIDSGASQTEIGRLLRPSARAAAQTGRDILEAAERLRNINLI